MANCPPYGCYDNWEDIGEGELCFSRKQGGIDAAILFKCGTTLEDVTEDADPEVLDNTKIEAMIQAGTAKYIPGIQVTINAPSPVNAPSGNPCVGESAITYDRTLTWQDFNVGRPRQQFYDSINAVRGFPLGGVLLKSCSEDMFHLVLSDLKFNGGHQSPEQATEAQFFEFDVTFRGIYGPEIFEQSLAVFE